MAKKSNKKIIIWSILIVLAIFIIIAIVGFMSTSKGEVSYFYDKDLGMIKITVSNLGFFDRFFKLFQQTITFSRNTAVVNEEVSLEENYVIPDGYNIVNDLCIKEINLYIKKDDVFSKIKTLNQLDWPAISGSITLRPWDDRDTIFVQTKFTPDSIGIYSGITEYIVSSCINPILIKTPFNLTSSNEITVNSQQLDCLDTWICFVESRDTKREITLCTRQYESDDTCKIQSRFETSCSQGYQLENGQTYAEDIVEGGDVADYQRKECIPVVVNITNNCVLNSSLCNNGQTCNSISKLCVDNECNGDKVEACPDLTNVTLKVCVNNKWEQNKTQTLDTACIGHTNTTTPNNETVVTCYLINSTSDTCYSATYLNSCINNSYATLATCEIAIPESGFDILLIVSIILGVLALGAIIFMVIRFTRSK